MAFFNEFSVMPIQFGTIQQSGSACRLLIRLKQHALNRLLLINLVKRQAASTISAMPPFPRASSIICGQWFFSSL